MNSEFWISQLGRLYKEAHDRVGEGGEGAVPLVEQFNDMLENLQEHFPENEFVQSMDTVSSGGRHDMRARQDAATNVRAKTGQLADAIGYDLPEEELQSGNSPMNVVKVEAHQTTEQTVEQSVTVKSTMEMINHLSRDKQTADELRSLVEQFENELDSEDTDVSLLRDFIEQAKQKSPEVAANLGALALQKGIVGILGI